MPCCTPDSLYCWEKSINQKSDCHHATDTVFHLSRTHSKKTQKPHPNHFSLQGCKCIWWEQPWILIARLWQWPFVSYLVWSDQSLIISTLLRFSHIYFKLFSCFICTLFISCGKHSVHAFFRKQYSSGTSSCCRAVSLILKMWDLCCM